MNRKALITFRQNSFNEEVNYYNAYVLRTTNLFFLLEMGKNYHSLEGACDSISLYKIKRAVKLTAVVNRYSYHHNFIYRFIQHSPGNS
jgi:hypothetical protein